MSGFPRLSWVSASATNPTRCVRMGRHLRSAKQSKLIIIDQHAHGMSADAIFLDYIPFAETNLKHDDDRVFILALVL